jgi:anhydro-N-acetylmuramic acid kinase
MTNSTYLVVGLMSGTSLDGLDVAACQFDHDNGIWQYKIIQAETIEYSDTMLIRLKNAAGLSGLELAQLNVDLGILHGNWVKEFLIKHKFDADFISSHGHTIFHQPEKSLTLQIGSAPHIAAATGLAVVSDFRTTDVAIGGQGAPLVPIGDAMLFSEYDFCLNLGGIANISIKGYPIKAFDISPCNMALNLIANLLGKPYDNGGEIALSGKVHAPLLEELNSLGFYKNSGPKSLGREFFEHEFLPLLNNHKLSAPDLLRTITEHIAFQIATVIEKIDSKKMLVTGDGAFNTFLIERIKSLSNVDVDIPHSSIIQFKEALIFAFLGVLRLRAQPNALASVTGAPYDSVGGSVYLAPN